MTITIAGEGFEQLRECAETIQAALAERGFDTLFERRFVGPKDGRIGSVIIQIKELQA
jgi:hypothetical protein